MIEAVYLAARQNFIQDLNTGLDFNVADSKKWSFIENHKQCHHCNKILPKTKEFFYGRPDTKDKLQMICIKCYSDIRAAK